MLQSPIGPLTALFDDDGKLTQLSFSRAAAWRADTLVCEPAGADRSVCSPLHRSTGQRVADPCHRVIGSNGTLTGYGGGIERKQWLLAHEGRRLF